ncbi:cell division protein FtsL [Jeotgalibacillus marinus]|uniref:Cell division protein FtsL n=1 Tax=Jeotgalibacillus marinus TaxID=86667 RepID=A0ABV3Q3H4_9BACL
MVSSARQLKEQQQVEKVKRVRVIKDQSSRFTLGEKILAIGFIAFILFASVQVIYTQAEIYQTNKDIQALESKIVDQQNINKDHSTQISQKTTPERVLEKAKELGLTLDENKVKGVTQP